MGYHTTNIHYFADIIEMQQIVCATTKMTIFVVLAVPIDICDINKHF